MRCRTCNENLTTGESVTKDKFTGEFIDICGACSSVVNKSLSEFEWTNNETLYDKRD